MTAPVASTKANEPRPAWVGGVLGVTVLLVAWELLALTVLKGKAVPEPWRVLVKLFDDLSFMRVHVQQTLYEAGMGWLIGNGLAIFLALGVTVIPFLERAVVRLAVVVYCLPVLAIGPILEVVLHGDAPKIALASLAVFFTTLIGALLGLRSADRTSLDLVRAYGGGRFRQLLKVRVIAALPSLFAALRIAAPSAVLGAIIGEYLGGERGLGIALVNAQQQLEIERTWALALVAAALAGTGFGLTALVGRALTSWAPKAPQG